MSDRLGRLILLFQIKQENTHKAYLELLKAKDLFNQNKARHEQLVGYRQEYMKQLEVMGQQGTMLGPLRNRLNFINHLDTALIQLNAHLAQLAKARTKADLNYKQAKTAEEGINKLIERVKKAEEYRIQRQEQKEMDEYARKQWYNKLNNDHEKPLGE
jgi:flagellar FliJ protein